MVKILLLLIACSVQAASPVMPGVGGRHCDATDNNNRLTTTVTPNTILPAGTSFTIEFMDWIKSGVNTDNRIVIGTDSGSADRFLLFHMNGDQWQTGWGDSYNVYNAGPAPARDRWFHVAFVLNQATERFYIYYDGVLKLDADASAYCPATFYNAPMFMFNHGPSVGSHYTMNGAIAEFRIWKGVRSQGQIQSYMWRKIGMENAPNFPELMVYMPFDESGAGFVRQTVTGNGIVTAILGTSVCEGPTLIQAGD